MQSLNICPIENSVPEGFADWVKLGITKGDSVSKKVSLLLSDNELELALYLYHNTLHRALNNFTGTHRGNNRIH